MTICAMKLNQLEQWTLAAEGVRICYVLLSVVASQCQLLASDVFYVTAPSRCYKQVQRRKSNYVITNRQTNSVLGGGLGWVDGWVNTCDRCLFPSRVLCFQLQLNTKKRKKHDHDRHLTLTKCLLLSKSCSFPKPNQVLLCLNITST